MTKEQALAQAQMDAQAQQKGFVLLKFMPGTKGGFGWCLADAPVPQDAHVVQHCQPERNAEGEISWRCHVATQVETEWVQLKSHFEQCSQVLDTKELHLVQWAYLKTPFGNNPMQFPYVLCALLSLDPIIRREALQTISSIEYNDAISTATLPAVRFLLQLVKHPTTPDRASILDTLLSVARADYYEPDDIVLSPLAYREPLPSALHTAYGAYRAIGEAVPFFLSLLAHPDGNIRRLVSSVLGCYPGKAQEILPTLEQAFEQEQDEQIQVLHLFNLCNLARANGTLNVDWLERLRQRHPSELVRFYATLQLASLYRESAPIEVVQALEDWFAQKPEPLRQQYESIPDDRYFGSFYNDLLDALKMRRPTER